MSGAGANAGAGAGVPVVVGRAGGGFLLDAAALRGVLAGAAGLRALPVAVLSVAGATRGGKSFLLDFCLRYLRATPSAQSDGSWLGADDDPLEGFSWRGGCDRDTVGIHIWSEPFVLTRKNGEKVVILLMDTQGTFDSSSTIQDSTTIFAMSTLLSSMQIFNISGNIQEDHLQYLQLFTEYGKLAKEEMEECGTPFQDLLFLVRDWSYAYQHPLGAAGGQQLLEKRLQIVDGQAEELREVRQHIQASFESVRGFLMPHPGLAVTTSPHFNGCLADVSKEFRDALVELVHALFEENLTLKKVNGQEIQIQELVEYFKSYMEMFNSDKMPTPVTILKATSAACLQTARSCARALYERSMSRGPETAEGAETAGRSSPRGAVERRHAAAAEAARRAFLQRRTLAPPERAAETLDLLMLELNGQFANYAALNEANTQTTISASKALYTERMLHLTKCLLPTELEVKHCEAMEEAMALFDRSRLIEQNDDGTDQEDEDRTNLQKELNNFLNLRDEIEKSNEANINAAMVAALQKYEEEICKSQTALTLCLIPDHLTALHSPAMEAAEEFFRSQWVSQGSALNEPVAALLDKIYERLRELQSFNAINNKNAVDVALKFYKNNMKYDILNDGCLHPRDLLCKHKELYKSTLTSFYRSRTYGDTWDGRDNQMLRLIRELAKSQVDFIQLNEQMNADAVKVAHSYYEVGMQIIRSADALPELMGAPDFDLFQRHKLMKPRAINKFKELREDGPIHAEDKHLDELNKLINSSFRWLVFKFAGMGILSVGTFFLLRRFSFL